MIINKKIKQCPYDTVTVEKKGEKEKYLLESQIVLHGFLVMVYCVYFYPPACAAGYFGANCSRECSPHCKPDTCRHADGSCTCTAGWMGNNCTTGNDIKKDIQYLKKKKC